MRVRWDSARTVINIISMKKIIESSIVWDAPRFPSSLIWMTVITILLQEPSLIWKKVTSRVSKISSKAKYPKLQVVLIMLVNIKPEIMMTVL